jgi:glycosyltransferase involved in cell wall biosynthesis
MKELFIYCTTFNNKSTVIDALKSLVPLSPKAIYIIDNFSTDGAFEDIQKYANNSPIKVVCRQVKSSRGRGRQLALEMALKEADDDDFLMYADLDTIYRKAYFDYVLGVMKRIKKDEVYWAGTLAFKEANAKIPWRDLNACETEERQAHFKHEGYKLMDTAWDPNKDALDNIYFLDSPGAGKTLTVREGRYSRGMKLKIRLFKDLIDMQKGRAMKSFKAFYSQSQKKNILYELGFFAAYAIAKIEGVYSYDSKLSNPEYIHQDAYKWD